MKNKSQILQDCCAYFYQNGFHGTSIDLIAKHANVTKRTLYRYFDSKDVLIMESLTLRHERFMQHLTATLENFSNENTVQGYLTFLKKWLLSDASFGCMFINACGEFPESSHPVNRLAQQHKQAVLAVLETRFLTTKSEDAQKMALGLFIYGEGLIVARQTGILTDNMVKSLNNKLF